jgi:hypothetical protein
MNSWVRSRPGAAVTKSALSLLAAMAVTSAPAPAAWAQEAAARDILKSMSDYVSRQGNLSLRYDADVEVVTQALEKIQFSASGDVTINRPSRFRISRTGGYAEVELISDGSNVTIYDRGGNKFAQIPAGSFDETVDRLRTEAPVELPGADLLMSKPYDELMARVLESKHIGRGVVDGVECEHLAFRNLDTDWQIWVEVGDRPVRPVSTSSPAKPWAVHPSTLCGSGIGRLASARRRMSSRSSRRKAQSGWRSPSSRTSTRSQKASSQEEPND